MDVVKKINRMRLERGWSVYRLAVEANLPQSTLTNMFNRETLPSITTLDMICRAYGVTMAEFFAEEGASAGSRMNETEFRKAVEGLTEQDKALVWALIRRLSEHK